MNLGDTVRPMVSTCPPPCRPGCQLPFGGFSVQPGQWGEERVTGQVPPSMGTDGSPPWGQMAPPLDGDRRLPPSMGTDGHPGEPQGRGQG